MMKLEVGRVRCFREVETTCRSRMQRERGALVCGSDLGGMGSRIHWLSWVRRQCCGDDFVEEAGAVTATGFVITGSGRS